MNSTFMFGYDVIISALKVCVIFFQLTVVKSYYLHIKKDVLLDSKYYLRCSLKGLWKDN
jgi:hypothetical protein